MPRHLTSRSTLEGLKREAKRWLRALRENVGDVAAQARARLGQALPNAPPSPTLRDVQHALAREHGFDGWTALKQRLAAGAGVVTEDESTDERVARFLEYACPDHHVRGGPAHARARYAAMSILERFPDIVGETFHTAVVGSHRPEVERLLALRPDAAKRPNDASGTDRSGAGHMADEFRPLGPKQWEPLLFLAFTRLPTDAVTENAVDIARLLLDHGANPNAFFMAGSSRYTPLVGAIGEGEEDRPPHQQRDALVRLLLDRGAEPYDTQVLYNIHFHGSPLWYLKLVHEYSLKLGRAADWRDPDWSMLGMGGYGPGAYYLLSTAVRKNDVETTQWILEHGANPNLPGPYHPKFDPKVSLYEEAVRKGYDEIARLLVDHGATRTPVVLTPAERFSAAAMRFDRAMAEQLVAEHPEVLRTTQAMFGAATGDRDDLVRLLLDLGVSPDVADGANQRPLHIAAFANAVKTGRLLIERGAEIDPVATNYSDSPLGAANYANAADMIHLLAPLSSDLWEVVYAGDVDRARTLLDEKPERARTVTDDGQTPLMWLPVDDKLALAVAKLFVARGADPSTENAEGQTASDRAERLGLLETAAYLRSVSEPRSTSGGGSPPLRLTDYELRAQTLLDAYRTGTREAMDRLYRFTWHRRTWPAMRAYIQLDLGRAANDPGRERDITLDDARRLIAREHGFESWRALEEYVASVTGQTGAIAAKPVALLRVDDKGRPHAAGRTRDWGGVIAAIGERGLAGLDANGQMTDALLAHVAGLENITVLKLNGSHGVTDDGLRHLARLPRLRHLEIDGTAITDKGLEVLCDLPELRSFSATWTRTSDVGVAHLVDCERLESVNVVGTACGDGTIAALRGKDHLRYVKIGNAVTDAGLPLLHDFPVFKTWRGGDVASALLRYEGEPNHVMLRGPITDRGVAALAGLDGLAGLNLDDRDLPVTGPGLGPLTSLANLTWFAFDAKDDAMPYIAAMPALRFLGCQDTQATDDGWVALSRSKTIERIWGRRCYGLGSRGFVALADMPALRSLAASCKNVDDSALTALPRFPALTELMPIDVPDDGYRQIGQCQNLDTLTLMYCRETTDRSTEQIVGLPKLRRYFASYNNITDRSLELLARISSLEEVELSAVAGVTNNGVAALARLPRLRGVRLSGDRLTRDVLTLFPPHVHVHYEL